MAGTHAKLCVVTGELGGGRMRADLGFDLVGRQAGVASTRHSTPIASAALCLACVSPRH